MHLAELNIGRLVAPTDEPRVKEFIANLDMINGLGKSMPGFVWMMAGSGDPQFVANLTVWEDATNLERLVWGTIHPEIYERREEWFELMRDTHFVMWWMPAGHEPALDEALERLARRQSDGDSDAAIGRDWPRAANMHKRHGCRPAGA